MSVAGPAGRFKPQQHAAPVKAAAAGIAATLARRESPHQSASEIFAAFPDPRQETTT